MEDDCVAAYEIWRAAVKKMNDTCKGEFTVEEKIIAARELLEAEKSVLLERNQ